MVTRTQRVGAGRVLSKESGAERVLGLNQLLALHRSAPRVVMNSLQDRLQQLWGLLAISPSGTQATHIVLLFEKHPTCYVSQNSV